MEFVNDPDATTLACLDAPSLASTRHLQNSSPPPTALVRRPVLRPRDSPACRDSPADAVRPRHWARFRQNPPSHQVRRLQTVRLRGKSHRPQPVHHRSAPNPPQGSVLELDTFRAPPNLSIHLAGRANAHRILHGLLKARPVLSGLPHSLALKSTVAESVSAATLLLRDDDRSVVGSTGGVFRTKSSHSVCADTTPIGSYTR